MLTQLAIRNFKRLRDVDIELGRSVVFVGPNNSGKTSALQALALWDVGRRMWSQKRGNETSPEKRPGVTLNRKDLTAIPVPNSKLLWRNLHVREQRQTEGIAKTGNIVIHVIVDGINNGKWWQCGLEFDYANEESFYCRPIKDLQQKNEPVIPPGAQTVKMAYLPPMSGLAAEEPKWEPGRINVLIGEGQTAQVLRNLCYGIHQQETATAWNRLHRNILDLFGVDLEPPEFIVERGEITMGYREHRGGPAFDLSSSGRGLQQTLLLLAHLYANPGATVLLDEPDAHLEVLRQREIYNVISALAQDQDSQIIAASHSEVVLNEAADKGLVIAFLGKPHRIDDRGSQLRKSLNAIGYDQYHQAEQRGWVLYLEGPTDLEVLKALACKIGHPVAGHLQSPFVHYVANQPAKARDHFHGLRYAKTDLVGFALFARLDLDLVESAPLFQTMWKRREIENYICNKAVLLAYAERDLNQNDFFDAHEIERRRSIMEETIERTTDALRRLRNVDPWSADVKVTDDFLDPLFREYFTRLGLPQLISKTNYSILAGYMDANAIDPEVVEKLDELMAVAMRAHPCESE